MFVSLRLHSYPFFREIIALRQFATRRPLAQMCNVRPLSLQPLIGHRARTALRRGRCIPLAWSRYFQSKASRFTFCACFFTPCTSLIQPERKIRHQEDLFRYTSGRWLVDEERQLQQRYVKFNVESLCAQAASIFSPATQCTRIVKLEGNYNKAFLLSMDNGSEVVAKIPCPNAGPPSLTTVSEVATLQFCMCYWCVAKDCCTDAVTKYDLAWLCPFRTYMLGAQSRTTR